MAKNNIDTTNHCLDLIVGVDCHCRRGSICCEVLRITDLRRGHPDEDFGIALPVADMGSFRGAGGTGERQ